MSAATVTGRYVSIKSGNVTAAKIFRHTEQRICFHSLIVVISPRMNTVRQRFKRLCPMEESTVSTSAPFANLNMAEAIFIITLTHARIAAGAMFMSISKHEKLPRKQPFISFTP